MSKNSSIIDDFSSRIGKVRTLGDANKRLLDSFGNDLKEGGKCSDIVAVGGDDLSSSCNNSDIVNLIQKFKLSKEALIEEQINRLTEMHSLCASLGDYRRLLAEVIKYCSAVGRSNCQRALRYKQLEVPSSLTLVDLNNKISSLNTLIKCAELFSIDIKKNSQTNNITTNDTEDDTYSGSGSGSFSSSKLEDEAEIVQFVRNNGKHIQQLRQYVNDLYAEVDSLTHVSSKNNSNTSSNNSNSNNNTEGNDLFNMKNIVGRLQHKSCIGLDLDDCIEYLDNFKISSSLDNKEEKEENINEITPKSTARGYQIAASSSCGALGLSDEDLHHLLPLSTLTIYASSSHPKQYHDSSSSYKGRNNEVIGAINKAILKNYKASNEMKMISNSIISKTSYTDWKISIIDSKSSNINDNTCGAPLWRHVSKSVVVNSDSKKTSLVERATTSGTIENRIEKLRNEFKEIHAKCIENNNLPLPAVTIAEITPIKQVAMVSSIPTVAIDTTTASEVVALASRDNNNNSANKRSNDSKRETSDNSVKISLPAESVDSPSLLQVQKTSNQMTAPTVAAQNPSLTESKKNNSSLHDQVVAWYTTHDSSKLNTIPSLLAKYAGKEGELVSKFEKKYGPCPLNHVSSTAAPTVAVSDKSDGPSARRPRAANSADFTAESTPIFSISKTGTVPGGSVSISGGSTSTNGGFFNQGGNKVSTSPFAAKSSGNTTPTPFGQASHATPFGSKGLGEAVSPFSASNASIGFSSGFVSPSTPLFGGGGNNNSTSLSGLLTPPKGNTTSLFGGVASASSNSSTAKFGFGLGSNLNPGGATSPFAVKTSGFASPSGRGQATSLFGNGIANNNISGTGGGVEERVRAYYIQYNPVKLNDVPSLLLKYTGREMELLMALEKKYGKLSNQLPGLQQQQQQQQPSALGGGFGKTPFGSNLQQGNNQQQQGSSLGSVFGGGMNAGRGTVGTLGFGQQQQQQQILPMGGFGQQTRSLFQH